MASTRETTARIHQTEWAPSRRCHGNAARRVWREMIRIWQNLLAAIMSRHPAQE